MEDNMDFILRFGIGALIGFIMTPFLLCACKIGFGVLFDVLTGGHGPDPDSKFEYELSAVMFIVIPIIGGFVFATGTHSL